MCFAFRKEIRRNKYCLDGGGFSDEFQYSEPVKYQHVEKKLEKKPIIEIEKTNEFDVITETSNNVINLFPNIFNFVKSLM